ncbi:MAG: hypothetical protein A2X84_04345 [Desulfuromonadaceae bacterium GWC2_58_13]|nr:MAG: hypothetical protein A2X84_04345 [Desulfuromonadaceae bacterium GWC2_58_13]
MTQMRTGRRKYYDIFSHFYDAFIRMHSRQDEDDTRGFLVNAAHLEHKPGARILDICCGTGSVVLTFAERHPEASAIIGTDFSHGMLRRAREKNRAGRVVFIEGDAAKLPFADDSFDAVSCSHALYELKGETRQKALHEMKRVIKPDGVVLLMEHEVPQKPLIRFLFRIRMLTLGSKDAREFMGDGEHLKKIFPHVELSHSRTGKSKLMSCRK